MKTKRCPKCKTDVALEESNCPACPYSFPEEQAEAGEIHTGAAWSPVPMIFLLALAAIVAASWLMVFRRGAPGAPETSGAPLPPLRKDLEEQQLRVLTQGETPPPAEPQAQSGATYTLPKEEEPVEAVVVGVEPGIREASESPKVTEWRFRGKVYDLVGLKPLAGAKVVFSNASSEVKGVSVTDAQGAYKTVLPALGEGGYQVSVQARGYSRSYLNPEVEDVPGMPLDRRAELAKELAATVMPPSELTPYGAQPLITDLYLAPSR